MTVDSTDNTDMCLLTPAAVAQLLGVSRSWLYAAAQSGRIPCVRLGGDDGPVRFLPAELNAWIAQGRGVKSVAGERLAERPPREDGRQPRGPRRSQSTTDVAQLRLIPPAEL